MQRLEQELRDAATALVARIKHIHDDPLYQGVWHCAQNHGLDYHNGPKYDKELAALEAILARQPEAAGAALDGQAVWTAYATEVSSGEEWPWSRLDEVNREKWERIAAALREQATPAVTESKLQAFKDYVHQRLDEAGVPADPPSPHRDAGCRIGGRLDLALAPYVSQQAAPAGATVEGLESRLRGRAGPFTAQPGERYVDADLALAVLREALAQAAPGDDMAAIGRLISTQDNRITAEPIFIVQQKRKRVAHADYDNDGIVWVNDDHQEADEAEHAKLEAQFREDGNDEPDGWRRLAIAYDWVFVTACFTEQGCKDYIARDGHNLKEPRIYADGSYRNEEWRAVRKFLLSLAASTPPGDDAAGGGHG